MSAETTQAALDLAAGKVAPALEVFRAESWRNPSYQSFVNLAAAERSAGQLEDAAQSAWRAVKFNHTRYEAWHNLGNIRADLGQFDHALEHYSRALAIAQGSEDVAESVQRQIALAFATALMRQRRFTEAWPAWEIGRMNMAWWPLPGTKIWAGERAESILIICEGGFGDAMLFSRWLPMVKERVKRVRLWIWQSLFNWRDWRLLGVDEVISKEDGVEVAGTEFSISWMSLPGVFGMRSMADVPEDHALDKWPIDKWGDGGAGSDRIGFCWRAEENSTIRLVRSLDMNAACVIARKLQRMDYRTWSLVPRGKQLYRESDFQVPALVLQNDSLINSWEKTTEFVLSCRAVITVDTAVAHLAGLSRVPTLLLLPLASDWKWGTGANTPNDLWYGPHVRYFRNPDPLKWDVDGIKKEIDLLLCVE